MHITFSTTPLKCCHFTLQNMKCDKRQTFWTTLYIRTTIVHNLTILKRQGPLIILLCDNITLFNDNSIDTCCTVKKCLSVVMVVNVKNAVLHN